MTMPTTMRFLLAALLLVVFAAGQTIQLADGSLLLAKVDEASGDGLRVTRLDNGGALDLRWDQLSPGSALTIKRKWALAGEEQDEVLARAEEVEYYVDGQKQTLIGKIVERTDTHNVLKTRGVIYRIPIKDIGRVRAIEVPVRQIYTQDEWYALRLAKLEDAGSADQHMLMVEELIKVRDYSHGRTHLEKAREIGNSRDPDRLERLGELLARYEEAAKERELIDRIIAARSRGTLSEFEKGRTLVEQFETEFPASRLKDEFDFEKKRFEETRRSFYSRQLSDYFRRSISSVANKKVGESMTLQAARDYAENEMTDDLFERAAKQFRVEPEEARELWAARENYTAGKRTELFSYGIGSWVLGEQAVLKDTDAAARKEKQKGGAGNDTGGNRELERLKRLMKEAMERRGRAGQGGRGQQQEETDEDWWRSAKRAQKAGWLRAYYAEFGGQLVVKFATASVCVSCYGKGSMPEIGPDGKLIEKRCFLCHGTKWTRNFKAY